MGDPGMVGGHESSNDLWHEEKAAPLVRGQKFYLRFQGVQAFLALEQFHCDLAQKLLCQGEEVLCFQGYPHRRDLHRLPRGNLFQMAGVFPGEVRLKTDLQVQVREGISCFILDGKVPDDGNIILLHGKIDRAHKIPPDGDARGDVR